MAPVDSRASLVPVFAVIVGCFVTTVSGNQVILHTNGCRLPINLSPDSMMCVQEDESLLSTSPGQEVPAGTSCYVDGCDQVYNGLCEQGNVWTGFDFNSVYNYTCDENAVNLHKGTSNDLAMKHREKRFFGFITTVVVGYCVITKCWEKRTPRDTTAPVLHNCPPDLDLIADPGQVNTKVYWVPPTATDNVDNVQVTRSGLEPGKLFTGDTYITYYAKDRSSNTASCSFRIRVTVVICKQLQAVQDGYKLCAPSTYMMYGTICWFGCYTGHEMVGSSPLKCLISGDWTPTRQPTCKKKECPSWNNAEPGIKDRNCTSGNLFQSICTFSCIHGYDILPGLSRVQVCSASGIWKGEEPVCVDTEPPTFTSCPVVKTFYADRSVNKTSVSWAKPSAEDNSQAVSVVQSSGPSAGDVLTVGVYEVVYTARDGDDNIATCSFKVIVKQIRCYTIYPLPYTSVTCPDGTRFGSMCQFACENGTVMNGAVDTSCERKSNGNYPYGYWSFQNQQSHCTVADLCPVLDPPMNGALACDVWKSGPLCIPMCEKGFYFPYEFKGNHSLLTCEGEKGWRLESSLTKELKELPNCGKISDTVLRFVKADIYFYYSGQCEESIAEIKENFGNALRSSQFYQFTCEGTSKCSIKDIQVKCGERNDSIQKRSDDEHLTISVELALHTSTEVMNIKTDAGKLRYEFAIALKAITEDTDSLKPNGTADLTVVATKTSPVSLECEPGSEVNMDSLWCVLCTPGFYQHPSTQVCTKCPRGQYQPMSGQTTCMNCPKTMTTLNEGSYRVEQCVATCQPGQFSASGVPSCSPCPPGTYSDTHGTMECTKCPGSQISDTEGAIDPSSCQEFDIVFPAGDSSMVNSTFTLDQTANTFYLSIWLQCVFCDDVSIVSMETDWTLFHMQHKDTLRLHLNGTEHRTSLIIQDGKWHNIQMTLNSTQATIRANGIKETVGVPSGNINNDVISGNVTITIGGSKFAGSVSYLNVWSDESPNLEQSANKCFVSGQGDLVSWRSFSESYMEEAFVQSSNCDDMDACLSSPCYHGNCTDTPVSYTCSCEAGYTGHDCDVNIDDCAKNVCENGAICQDDVTSYNCICTPGFSGKLCEIKVVDGGFGKWSSWSECSMSCGNGVQSRYRACDSPPPDNGGDDCHGNRTEEESCSIQTCVYECDKQPEIINGKANCTKTGTSVTCLPYCVENHDFDRPLPLEVTCGPHTNNEWNFVNDHNPDGLLPMCTEMKVPKTNNIDYNGTYTGMNCGQDDRAGTESNIKQTIEIGIHQLYCISAGTCQISGTNVNGCETSRRRKRSTDVSIDISITLTCDTEKYGLQTCLDTLVTAYNALQSYVSSLSFTITQYGVQYNIDPNTTLVSGSAGCYSGQVPVNYYCLPCGTGTYQLLDECLPCELGQYQDQVGQVTCLQCTEGFSTRGYGTRNVSNCDVPVAVPETDPALYWLIGVGVGVVVLLTLIITLAVISFKNVSKKPQTPVEAVSLHGHSESTSMTGSQTRLDHRQIQQIKSTTVDAYKNDGLDVEAFEMFSLPSEVPPMLHQDMSMEKY